MKTRSILTRSLLNRGAAGLAAMTMVAGLATIPSFASAQTYGSGSRRATTAAIAMTPASGNGPAVERAGLWSGPASGPSPAPTSPPAATAPKGPCSAASWAR
jgi:hypothetical protein